MIVVDIGCESHAGAGRLSGTEESVRKLIDRYRPHRFFGFDPQLERTRKYRYRRVTVQVSRLAAWLYDGNVPMHLRGAGSGITHDEAALVPCFDFPRWLETMLGGGDELVLKLDCEGCEYPLLWAIHHRGLDEELTAVLVEWHEGIEWRGDYPSYGWHIMGRPPLRCEVLEW